MGDLGTRLACTFWGLIASEKPSETLEDLKPTPCEGVWIVESMKVLNVVSGLLHGLWNPECSSRSSGIQSLDAEFTAWNPESNTVLDSLTWGYRVMPGAFRMVEGLVTILRRLCNKSNTSS